MRTDRLAALRESCNRAIERERRHGLSFLLAPVALGLGATTYALLPREPLVWPLLLAFAASGMGAAALHRRGQAAAVLLMLMALALAGILAGRLEAQRLPPLLDGRVVTTLTGRILSRDIDAKGRVRYLIAVATTREPTLKRPPRRVRVLAREGPPPLPIGSNIAGRAMLSPPSGPAYPGSYDFAHAAFSRQIAAYGFFFGPPRALADAPGDNASLSMILRAKLSLDRIRDKISARVRQVAPGDGGALIAALSVSDRRGISERTVDQLRATGLAHILAISGLHMALAAGTVFAAFRKLFSFWPRLVETRPVKKYAAAAAMLVATGYLLISGAGIATQRAWIMMIVMFGAILFDRPALTMRNVAIAAALILLISPSAVVSPGFQMSFAATGALIAAYDIWVRRPGSMRSPSPRASGLASQAAHGRLLAAAGRALNAVARLLGGLAMTSLVAGLATGAFAAWHFHRIAVFGLLANVAAMPIVTLWVMPAGLLSLLAMPFGLDHWPLRLTAQGLSLVIAIAATLAEWGGDRSTGRLPLLAMALLVAGLIALIVLRTRLRAGGVGLILIGVILMLPPFRPPRPDLLVSEDARLVAMLSENGIAANADRPNSFLFEQWTAAYPHAALVPPQMQAAPAPPTGPPTVLPPEPITAFGAGTMFAQELARQAAAQQALAESQLLHLIAASRKAPSQFLCSTRAMCAARFRERTIVVIARPDTIGLACDHADLVILAAAIRMQHCRSGAELITGRMLRRSGALAISLPLDAAAQPVAGAGMKAQAPARSSKDSGAPQTGPPSPITVRSAVKGIIRPWTVQRYYDWRRDAFLFPDAAAARARIDAADRSRTWQLRPDTSSDIVSRSDRP
ncbi:ComEC/Rec2 family competence protein [Pseudohoeflea coraliihabitans]|uniref:ComEC family competence protein n=1 Tax=Pseudohoeflea coraliihabitans TaxID=2860393 RepID=A0ABS6WRC1_9HYPH|nr:ComEC/Rec2 family competence protein [Pseudohoeflea sp. DP4N28-3]MBW3098486.1 ComEC family competence protein [Pseudohoeflea sp. DP4N28-3]